MTSAPPLIAHRKMERRNAMLPTSQEAITVRIFCQSIRRAGVGSSNGSTSEDSNTNRTNAIRRANNVVPDETDYSSDSSMEFNRVFLRECTIAESEKRVYGAPSA
eukprot:CAMPEP_0183720308 /NCGR_PEP_ID=MMETSP0737-20130205/12956_1 /TAXON_ID=385413 /ORGANISM="Thalassiosira miniscula, Strain CCMP1093" /LENGTH=104 /DNA_ID=CAMNT_0025950153 /DNA_START=251 /DNA_END=565 /DNA_ORIENTATION=+